MMRAIVRFCLRFPHLTLIAGLGGMAIGIMAAANARYGVFPQFAPPTINVETTASGLPPKQIEGLVTTPVENAVIGTPGLATLRSTSETGLSVVTAVFRGNTDIYRDQQLIAARLASLAGTLPDNAAPVIAPLQSSTGTALTIGLRANRLSLMQLTEIARWTIRPALMAVPGVAKVVIYGAEPEQLQVQLNPMHMVEAGIGLDQLTKAAGQASAVLGAGVIDTPNQQLFVEPHGQAKTAQELADSLLVQRGGRPLTLGDVAHVTEAPPPPVGGALVGTHRGLLLVVGSQYGAGTLGVTHRLEKVLAQLAPALKREGVIVLPDALRPASFITTALHHLRDSLAIGAILIVVVLFLWLRNWRTALISSVAIPLSLLMATLVLGALGFGLDTLSIGGLAIAVGEVVDDAVVDVENIHRRLRENGVLATPRSPFRVVLDASIEVRGAIVYATFAVVLVFIPVLRLSGVAGRLFTPLAVAYIAAVLSSLAVALTLTPAMAWMLLGKAPPPADDPRVMAFAKRLYSRALSRVDRHPRAVIGAIALLIVAAFASTPLLHTRFLPNFHEQQFIMHFRSVPGTSLSTTLKVGEQAARILEHNPDVVSVVLHSGRATLSNGHGGVNKAELDLTLTRKAADEGAAVDRKLLASVKGAPGVRWTSNTFFVERIHESLSGHTAPLLVTVYGPHLSNINRDANRIAAALRKVPGAAGVNVVAPPGTPELSVTLDRAAITRYGLTAAQVLRAIRTAYAGDPVGRIYTGSRSYPIMVTLPPTLREDPAALASIPLAAGNGGVVHLGALAHIQEEPGQAQILHQGARRVQVVTANVSGSASQFLARARPALQQVQLARGDYIAIGGTATASGSAETQLGLYAILALIAIIGLVVIALQDWRLVVLLLVNIPFALVGGIATVWIAGLTISLGAAIGFVTVFGITLRNALMLLSHYRHLVLEEGHPWSRETAELGAMHRLAPILMTATVTGLGLLPIALGANLPGQEIEGPMAIVILGGLVSSTALTLLVLPSLAARFARIKRPDQAAYFPIRTHRVPFDTDARL